MLRNCSAINDHRWRSSLKCSLGFSVALPLFDQSSISITRRKHLIGVWNFTRRQYLLLHFVTALFQSLVLVIAVPVAGTVYWSLSLYWCQCLCAETLLHVLAEFLRAAGCCWCVVGSDTFALDNSFSCDFPVESERCWWWWHAETFLPCYMWAEGLFLTQWLGRYTGISGHAIAITKCSTVLVRTTLKACLLTSEPSPPLSPALITVSRDNAVTCRMAEGSVTGPVCEWRVHGDGDIAWWCDSDWRKDWEG